LRRVVQFALGEFIERDAHRSDPGASLAKHIVRRTARQRTSVSAPVFRVILDDVKRRLRPILVPGSRQAR
jgi:hypothetical protein